MSCKKLESDIALYVGGDLPAPRTARVESHLSECADCRALAEDLRAGQRLLGELRDDPLEDAMVAQVHGGVMAKVRTAEASPRGALAPLLAVAAATVLAVILFWPRHSPEPAKIARVQPAPLATIAPAQRVKIVPARHRLVRRRRARAPQPGPPLLVQLVTNDPNIVIYWLVDQKPQGD